MSQSSKRDQIDDIAAYYQKNQEDARLNIQQLEFAVTQRLLAKYLTSPSTILELGAGSGRYTQVLASAGHQVTVIELVADLNEQNRKRLEGAGLINKVTLHTGDVRDYVERMDGPFDAILCMGPMYHLVKESDRSQLMNKMRSKLRKGGLLISTHVSRIGLMGYMLARYPDWAVQSPKEVTQVLEAGFLWDHPRNGEFRGYFTTVDDIYQSHAAIGLKLIGLHSQDPCIGSIDEIYTALPPHLKTAWTDILVSLSADSLALGSGRSLLSVARL